VSTDSNPWKEAILRSSIRHGHKFYEDDPEKSLEEARVVLSETEIRDRVKAQTKACEEEAQDAMDKAWMMEQRYEKVIARLAAIKKLLSETESKTT